MRFMIFIFLIINLLFVDNVNASFLGKLSDEKQSFSPLFTTAKENFYKNNHHKNHHNHPQNEFSKHTIIQPKVHHGKHKRAITSTLEEDGLHTSHITLSFHHKGQNVIADLQLNELLIPKGHFLRYQKYHQHHHHHHQHSHENVKENIVQNFTKTDVDLCHYQGMIRGNSNSRIAISTCNGINGIIFDGNDTYFIYSGPDGKIHDDHYLFSHSDKNQNATCGFTNEDKKGSDNNINSISSSNGIYHGRAKYVNGKSVDNDGNNDDKQNNTSELFNTFPDSLIQYDFNRILRYKRSTDDNTIRGPYNANKHSSFVELVIVVDNKVYKSFGENMKKVHNHCKDIANIVNALYVPLNIFIALVGVVVWNESNEIELSSDGDVTLKNFLHYRRKVLAQDHPNDNAQLLTKEQFSGGVVGKALKGPMCTYEYSGGVSMEHSQIVGVVATTVAHEMGHNFGMEHDTSDCKCKEEKCIMSASSTSIVPRYWSSCSVDQLNVAFSRGMNYCLRNKPTKLFDSPQCGNGFVEPGEQCDCGLPKYCENTCCDPNTCMLYSNASCATGECCDLKTCRPKNAGTECRSAEGECDLAEYCTGESEYCPSDVYKRDTEICDKGSAFCYQGSCRSRSNQCKILWGPSGESSEHCYMKNMDGTRHGNCGYDRIAQKYTQCEHENVYCGMLHCRHLNERLEFGMESAAVLSHSFMNHEGSIIPCRTAIVDLGLQSTDPGLTPNGAKCGIGKMCVNQKCVNVTQLRAEGQGVECPENCNGQGICNSKGHCHCNIGFAPPYCNGPGAGGSEDSGPATNPNGRVGFTRAMYIFFLGVVPTVSLFFFFTYYWKQNRSLTSSTRKPTTVLKTTLKSAPSRGSSSPPSGLPTSSPSSTDDMNSALLRSPTESDTSLLNNSMFGKFKGFTLRPLPNATTGGTHIGAPNVAFVHPVTKSSDENYSSTGVPSRIAPPPPKSPPSPEIINQQFLDIKPLKQNGTLPNMKISSKSSPSLPKSASLKNYNSTNAPALPPPNPGFNARPIISSPILEASTCTAKELISPLKSSGNTLPPVRHAPTVPPVPPHADPKFNQLIINTNEKIGFKDNTIKRIASFLKKDDLTLQKYPQKIRPQIDKEKLKNIEISAPIQVVDIIDGDHLEDRQISIARTQSMRDSSPKIPKIHSFGSMRQPLGANRPKSIVGSRPKSPPPRPPAPAAITNLKNVETANYQTRSEKQYQNEYDDCEAIEAPLANISEENSPTGSDNIYSVIDERPSLKSTNIPIADISGSNDSMGLLGEIVSEIEKRNVDSIYSVSTLKKNKSLDTGTVYANTPDLNDTESDYNKSNLSNTSSGYVRPSTINTPVARVAPTRPDKSSSTTLASTTDSSSSTATVSNLNSFSSFKPKPPVQPTNAETAKTTENNKPILNRTSSKTAALNNKTTLDSLRKHSNSPVNVNNGGQKTASINRSRSISNNASGNGRKIPIGESRNAVDVKKPLKPNAEINLPATITTNGNVNQPQKPKLLSKPLPIGTKPSLIEPTKLNRQTSITDKKSKLSTDQSQQPTRKSSVTMTSNNLNKVDDTSIVNSNNSINNTSSSSKGKILNAAARPAPGKISTVASLQQKFENNSTSNSSKSSTPTTNNGSGAATSNNNSLTTAKK